MRFASRTSLAVAASAIFCHNLVSAQTSTKCNPLTQSCPPDPALGRTSEIDFTSGKSSDFVAKSSGISYDSSGAKLTVAQAGNSPTLTSKWYIMFGRVDIEMKAAPGTGIVSSLVLQSDCLDEIDWEFLGSKPNEVQTNYFGKGDTSSYNRGAFHGNPGGQSGFKTYTIDWTSEAITWQIDGETVRSLDSSNAEGQYPQTPMQVKVGSWAGGDSSNAPGVVSWAGGSTDYSGGPYSMYVKSIKAQDYSTGTQYVYSGSAGTWKSINAKGGAVHPGGSSVDTAAPAVTSMSTGDPIPFEGTHAQPKSAYSTPTVWPWVGATGAPTSSSDEAATSIPGLPAGWTMTSSGKVQPPASAAAYYPAASSTPAYQASSSAAHYSAGGYDGATASLHFPVTPAPGPTSVAHNPYVKAAEGHIAGRDNIKQSLQTMSTMTTPDSRPAPIPTQNHVAYTGMAAKRYGVAKVAAAAGAFGWVALIL
ncbi:MAG: hypothetical protein M1831_006239 [Alyxoria varia]|nr:MAG: hypothetical protein M1831_006239 [Alyxoria varia]